MEKFYLGMDIGTESVGMACTDEQYHLLRAKGKDCWAVRLFDESGTAADRRNKRTARRRLERRKFRIGMLQSLFDDYIDDDTFFIRLNNSALWAEDKNSLLNGSKNSLFDDKSFQDKNYHKLYPTIFHLRKKLQEENCNDIRLYYLALHHIIKYRGHFLFEGGMEDVRNIKNLYETLNTVLDELFDENIVNFDIAKSELSKDILLSSTLHGKEKQKKLEELFDIRDFLGKELIKGICGGKISPKTIFGENFQEEKSFSFKELNDEVFENMREIYGDNFVLLESLRALYNYVTFEKLLEGQPNISSAMVSVYEKHYYDLQLLKKFLRDNTEKETYDRMFSSAKEVGNYASYAGHTFIKKKKIKIHKCKYEDFIKYTKQFMNGLNENLQQTEVFLYIKKELENNTFLPKILHEDNGLFPHQINEEELNKIVEKMVENFPKTQIIAEKIKSIFTFRVPYYVGPLTGKNGWAKRNAGQENVKITPWNFDEIIDKAGSNEEFMRRMTSKCSYLHAEDVLPKGSIFYQKYNVLNQINKLKINEQPLTVEQKQIIYNELCLTHVRISDKGILDTLVRHGFLSPQERSEAVVSGKDNDDKINASMSSYIQLKKILGDFVDADLQKEHSACEDIILWHTLNTDKNIVSNLILKNYGANEIIRNNIAKLKGLTFNDFGKLSKRLLTDIAVTDPATGEILSILDLLYDTNENLNEILFNEKYGFQKIIDEENGIESTDVSLSDIEKLYVSPAVRRGIYQSLKMADEYVQAIGKKPDKIFVEVTREDGEKGDAGRKLSRKKQLSCLFETIQGIEHLKEELKEKEDADLRSERLFLYFRQLGKCMYSGETIDLLQLNTNLYDIDHILPRTYRKDDSLDNKVLVLREKNADKADTYPIPKELATQTARSHWEVLREKKLISDTTYHRLTRTSPLTNDDYNDFINRQKVITDQTAKAVLELMKKKYPDAKIVYSKASNVSEFKNKFDLYKCRETNDLHHARDAYLNIVVGNVYDTCFSTPWGGIYQKNDAWHFYNLKTLFHRNIKGAWVQDNSETLNAVKKIYAKPSMAVTRYAYCNKGAFYNETVYPHTDTGITAPRKKNMQDTTKYGGFKSQTTAHFAIVQSENKKGQLIKTIEAIPVLVALNQTKNPHAELEYLQSILKNPTILVPIVKIKQLLSYNGTPVYIAGITGNQILLHNAVELFTDNKTDGYIKGLIKLFEMSKKQGFDKEKEVYIIHNNRLKEVKLSIDKEQNIILYDLFLKKLSEKIYQGLSGMRNFENNLLQYRNNFISLSTFLQAETLLQILKFFKCNAETSNLTNIGGSGISGKLLVNKDISDAQISLLSLSPCGLTLREKKI